MKNEIRVNGVVYVEKQKQTDIKIVRGVNSGVFYGKIIEEKGTEVTIIDCRRIWYWDGASSLSELAEKGTSSPENCKFPVSVSKIKITDACEILDITEVSLKSLEEVAIWTQH